MKIEHINPNNNSIYSDAVIAGDYIYLSGLVSENLESGEPIDGSIYVETSTILSNAALILKQCGSDIEKIIRVEIFLKDYDDVDELNNAYQDFFDGYELPSRICVAAKDFYKPSKIEMLITAIV